jgi:hypothetical protein
MSNIIRLQRLNARSQITGTRCYAFNALEKLINRVQHNGESNPWSTSDWIVPQENLTHSTNSSLIEALGKIHVPPFKRDVAKTGLPGMTIVNPAAKRTSLASAVMEKRSAIHARQSRRSNSAKGNGVYHLAVFVHNTIIYLDTAIQLPTMILLRKHSTLFIV